jgi:hypothetical protein
MSAGFGPCRPPVRLRIGVTGHRPGAKLPPAVIPAVEASVAAVFEHLSKALGQAVGEARWAFGAAAPQLVVVSALAEGADRIVAAAGLVAGASLEVVLPSPRAIYQRDFKAAPSKAEFRGLLDKASCVFELDDLRGPLGGKRGYEAAGLVTLAHADLLIAIWDEGEAAGIGGTASIVEQAVKEGAPVLLINPASPRDVRLLWTGDMDLPPGEVRVEALARRPAMGALAQVLKILVAPPVEDESGDDLRVFYRQPVRRRWGWPLYSIFLALLGVRPLRRSDFVHQVDDGRGALEWRALMTEPDRGDPLTDIVCETLSPAIAAPDGLAVRYGEFYRSAFIFNYLAAALAVVCAVTGMVAELPWLGLDEGQKLAFKAVLIVLEIGLIGAILAVFSMGARRGWHRSWLNYRRAAEWLRHLRILSLVGARIPIGRPRYTPALQGAHGAGAEQSDWVGWYVRTMERLLPLPNRVVDAGYMTAVRKAVIEAELTPQVGYNRVNSHRMMQVEHRLHVNGVALFWAPALVGLAFLGAYGLYVWRGLSWAEQMRFVVTGLTAALPAFGAALNAIRVQGDFETVAERSAATAARLAAIRTALESEPLEFARLADRVQRAAEVMSADLSEWRTLFRARPLSLPA